MSSKLQGKAAIGSLTLLAVLTGAALIPSAAASTDDGYFQIMAEGQGGGADRPTATYGMLFPKDSGSNPGGGTETPGTGEPTPQPPTETPEEIEARQKEEAAIAQWGSQVALPAGGSWSVGSGNGRFVIHDGAQGGYSTDGSTWNMRANQALVTGSGEIAYSGGVFFVANDLDKPSGKSHAYAYSTDNGNIWTSPVGSTYGFSKVAATKNGFVTSIPRSQPHAAGKTGVDYRIASFDITKIGGNVSMPAAPSGSKYFYSPIDDIAANSAQTILVVAESGRNRSTNYVKVAGVTKTVEEAGYGNAGLHFFNGTTWTEGVLPGSWRSVDWVDGQFIAVSTDRATVAKSSDGRTWDQSSTDLGSGFTKLVKSGDQLIALKQNTTPQDGGKVFATSTDGVKWTKFNIDPSKAWKDIAAQNGCFVAVSTSGTTVTTCK